MDFIDLDNIYKYYKDNLSVWNIMGLKEKFISIIDGILCMIWMNGGDWGNNGGNC